MCMYSFAGLGILFVERTVGKSNACEFKRTEVLARFGRGAVVDNPLWNVSFDVNAVDHEDFTLFRKPRDLTED